jgi:hypothetical protein
MAMKDRFRNPPGDSRTSPFLFLNHELQEEELRWQIRQFAEKGAGGIALHARFGLETPYFSREWWKAIDVIIEECCTQDLLVYLYDENVWPSGVANGQVIRENPELIMTGLQLSETWTVAGPAAVRRRLTNGPIAKAYAVLMDGAAVKQPPEVRELEVQGGSVPGSGGSTAGASEPADAVTGKLGKGVWEVRAFRRIRRDRGFLGGYADALNPDATRRFIELSHMEYARRYRRHFGGRIPAIFTDEPAFNNPSATSYNEAGGILTWSPVLEDEFLRRKGYPVSIALVAQTRDMGPASARYRCDFWEVATDLYCESFFRPVREFCDAQNLGYIGHLLYEGELIGLTRSQGDFFKAIRNLTYGGCDFLTDLTWPVPSTPWGPLNNVAAPKFASSASHLLGKTRTMSEAFGLGSRWAVSLRTLRHLTDWQVALGINLILQHAMYYTIQGFRKWDCPPSESYQNPFWPHYRLYADYAARLCEAFRDAEHVCSIALLVPTRTLWTALEPFDAEAVNQAVRGFENLGEALLRLQLDHDYISEELLWEAELENGAFALPPGADSPHRLTALVVPPSRTLSRRTVERLESFTAQGGRLVLCEPSAVFSSEKGGDAEMVRRIKGLTALRMGGMADGSPADRLTKLRGMFAGHPKDVEIRRLDGDGDSPAADGAENVVVTHYRKAGTDLYLLVNTDRENSISLEAAFAAAGEPARWLPETGEAHPVLPDQVTRRDGRTILELSLPPAASQLIGFSEDRFQGTPARLHAGFDGRVVRELPDAWRFRPLRGNALPLDRWQCELIPLRDHPLRTVARRIWKTSFQLNLELPQARLLLDGLLTEKVWNRSVSIPVEVFVNGRRIGEFEKGTYLDHLIMEAEIGGHLRKGENQLTIETTGILHEPGSVRHPAYLVGDFALERMDGRWAAVEPTVTEGSGSWTGFGYPFYSGAGAYSQSFTLDGDDLPGDRRCILRLSGVADLAEITLNGRNLGAVAWEPWEVELGSALRSGVNELEIVIFNSLTNLLEQDIKPSGLLGKAAIVALDD